MKSNDWLQLQFRSQFLKRIVAFARKYRLVVQLAYYPPYHSKYNPIERCWGVLEMHWNGSLLDSVVDFPTDGGRPVNGLSGSLVISG